ncbi:MAG: aldehyde dehydrogenase family protein [Pseudobdellovibrionaceae bacterium]
MSALGKADFITLNPATQKPVQKYSYLSWADAEKIVFVSDRCYRDFTLHSQVQTRCEWIANIGQKLSDRQKEFSERISLEMGKPIPEALAEITKCASLCQYFSKNAELWLQEQKVSDQYKIRRHPYGVVLGIMPWNYPFWQVFRFAIPALLSGNTVLLKHADQVSGCSQLLQELFQSCLPQKEIFQSLIVTHEVAEKIIQHPSVRMVSFTGSTKAGAKIASLCGASLKKCILELGGNDPYVITESADVLMAAKACAQGRLLNNGQSCVAAKRFLIHSKVFESFTKLFQNEFSKLEIGDPLKGNYDLGPLSEKRFVVDLESHCAELEKRGFKKMFQHPGFEHSGFQDATVGQGNFFAPRIYQGNHSNEFYDEEIFGPIAICYVYDRWDEVLNFITASKYGLGSAIFSTDQTEIDNFIFSSEAGFVGVNTAVKSAVEVPFGGFKQSGFGRELGQIGFHEFTQTKTVFTATN